jgi:hypothetical protein
VAGAAVGIGVADAAGDGLGEGVRAAAGLLALVLALALALAEGLPVPGEVLDVGGIDPAGENEDGAADGLDPEHAAEANRTMMPQPMTVSIFGAFELITGISGYAH